MQNFQELIKNNTEYPRNTKKNSCEISRGLCFWLWNFRGINIHNFTKFPGVEFCFTWNFQEVQKKTKTILGVVFTLPPPPPTLLVFASGIAHSKIIDLNWSYKVLAQKEALTICKDRAFASFSCVLSLYIISFRKVHTSVLWYWIIGEKSTLAWEVKPSSSTTFPVYVFPVNILSKAGENPQLYSIL